MNLMYDSVTAKDIPTTADIVAGYINGLYKWSDADWTRFPNARKVQIQVYIPGKVIIDSGDVLDVEAGNASSQDAQEQAARWVQMRYQSMPVGHKPCIYTSKSTAHFFANLGCDFWLADYTGQPHLIPGTVATQYASPSTGSGGHYDKSLTIDNWPYSGGGGTMPGSPCIGIFPTKSGNGYWLVGTDGGVFAEGDATFHGSLPGEPAVVHGKIVGFAVTPTEQGYWLVDENYGVYSFGDAQYHGHP